MGRPTWLSIQSQIAKDTKNTNWPREGVMSHSSEHLEKFVTYWTKSFHCCADVPILWLWLTEVLDWSRDNGRVFCATDRRGNLSFLAICSTQVNSALHWSKDPDVLSVSWVDDYSTTANLVRCLWKDNGPNQTWQHDQKLVVTAWSSPPPP